MKRVSMSGSPRENVGKKDAKALRAAGKVICVLYGGEKQVHFTLDEYSFNKIIFTPEVFVLDIEIDGTTYPAILQDVQYHPVSDKTLHADFLEVVEGKPVTVSIPVKLEGVAPGIIKGGILTQKLRAISVRGLVEDMPENIVVDISSLNIAQSVKIQDIDFGKLACQISEDNMVVGVKTARGALSDEEEEEGEEGEEEKTEE